MTRVRCSRSQAAFTATSPAVTAAPVNGSTVGAAVTTRTGSGGTANVVWTGRTNGGAVVPDGMYRLTLSATDHAGNHAPRSWTVRVDHTPATLHTTTAPTEFSPNGDGTSDTTSLAWTASERITGVARIVRGVTVIRSWAISAAGGGSISWNGRTASGAAVPDGTYAFRVVGRDAAGNLATTSASIVVDRTLSTVRWDRAAFFPQDGDALSSAGRVSFTLTRAASVSVGIYSGSTLIRTVWTGRTLAAGLHSWAWDGRDATGAFVARGTYQIRVTARSWVGTSAQSQAILVDAFAVALSATSVRAGQTLTVTVTTTEALRTAPTITFTQPGRATVSKVATALGSGRYRVTFAVATGAAGTATIKIAGRDVNGGLNVGSRSVTIQ
jgi:flagellar hook assembly protein FlgD